MNIIFALLLTALLPSTMAQSHEPVNAQKEIPTVLFCEMVKHPETYFDRPIRIAATVELGYEGSTLNDVRCPRSHDDQIGLGFVERAQQDKSLLKDFEQVRKPGWDTRARIVTVGILRNKSRRAFDWYRYRFELIRLESISRDASEDINTFAGTLMEHLTYGGMVRTDKDLHLSLVTPLRILPHHAVQLEWTNLDQFPALTKMREPDQRAIIFRVVSESIEQVSEGRWNRVVRLEVLLVE